jgi:threonine synthase
MGLPVRHFVAALNANDAAGRYITTGTFAAARAVPTISNAMDVGDPGNLPRIRALFDDDPGAIRRTVSPFSCTDDDTREAIAEAYGKYRYVFDPHGAVGYAALGRYRAGAGGRIPGIVLGTAHPAKFMDAYDGSLRGSITVPPRLQSLTGGEKHSVKLPARFDDLHEYLMEG